jgi:hypothetical protein
MLKQVRCDQVGLQLWFDPTVIDAWQELQDASRSGFPSTHHQPQGFLPLNMVHNNMLLNGADRSTPLFSAPAVAP